MPDKLDIQNPKDIELKKSLEEIDWNLDYGSIKIQIRDGKVTMVTVERTIRLD